MKKILVTQRLENNGSYYEQREMLDIRWGSLFEKLDLMPIVALTGFDYKKYFDELRIHGILLTGGNDLYSVSPNILSEKRDHFEKELMTYAIEKNIPIFGVCRGMQIIAKYFGSTFKKVENQIATRHKLKINQESRYAAYLEQMDEVNSFHSYGIDQIGNTLRVAATNKENIIKAIEHKELKIFGQMWHSEREDPFSEQEINLIKDFFND